VVETQILSLQKRIAELEQTSTSQEMPKEDQESRTKQTPTLDKQRCIFESRLANIEPARESGKMEDFATSPRLEISSPHGRL